MIRTAVVATVVATLVAGGWGCTQSPGGLAAKSNTANARLAQLEQELMTLKTIQVRQAEETAGLVESLKAERLKVVGLSQERDTLKADLAARQSELAARRTERDAARAGLDRFKLELKELLARAESGLPIPSPAALGSAGF